jgi:serine/threonine protein kinase/tetratricopeptide (TPR) repeat protein
MSADRNLVFGILAVQSGFCTGPQLVEAMNEWVLAKHRPLGAVLLERGSLKQNEHDLIEALVALQLAKHDGDADKSLASLTPIPRLKAELRRIGDADVQQSLAALPSSRSEDPDHTRTHETGSTGEAVRYRILRPHARGGLGEVFVARDEELGREVALKEIQSTHAHDHNSRDRFVREAEVTGGLEHPGVVAVYGLGSYADGRPFYAMRFIQGDSLKEAIERFHSKGRPDFAGGEFRQLLGRFIDVCQAIAYAHSRGVLHRDLKPGNIMLGNFGETLVVDWGLAKVVGTKEVEYCDRTLNISSGSGSSPTMQGQAIGTPAFMSPEQATGRLDELGPATDVYSLGATLYSLLANRPPIDADGVAEALRKAERGEWTPLLTAQPLVPAPLASVCAKAMALKPADRYPSAHALAADIERFLADEPLSVHRDPFNLRAGRWARKHRTLVAVGLAVLLVGSVAMGIGLAIVGDRNSKLAHANKKERERAEGEKLAKEEAVKRAVQVEKSNEILAAVFDDLNIRMLREYSDPLEAVLAKRLLKAGEDLHADSVGDPIKTALLQNKLGNSLVALGFAAKATSMLQKASDTLAVHLGPDHSETLKCANHLAAAYREAGKLELALPLLEDTLKKQREKFGPNNPDTLQTMNSYAVGLQAAGQREKALPIYEETLRRRESVLGADHTETQISRNNLASCLCYLKKTDRAIALFEEALRITKARFGNSHAETLAGMNNLAFALHAAGKLEPSLQHYEELLRLQNARLGADHPRTLSTTSNFAGALRDAGRIEKALPLYEESLRLKRTKLGSDHPDTLLGMNNLASALDSVGKSERARQLFEEASSGIIKRRFDHEYAHSIVSNAATSYEDAKQWQKAESWRRELAAFVKVRAGAQSPSYAVELALLGINLIKQQKYADAETVLRECVTIRQKTIPDAWITFDTQSKLGGALLAQRKYGDAESMLVNGFNGVKQRENFIPPQGKTRILDALDRLIELYTATNKPDEVKKWKGERAKYETVKAAASTKKPSKPGETKAPPAAKKLPSTSAK